MMNDHECDFSLMDVLTIITLGLFELLSLKIQQIVLDLKGNSQILHKIDQSFSLLCRRIQTSADHSC